MSHRHIDYILNKPESDKMKISDLEELLNQFINEADVLVELLAQKRGDIHECNHEIRNLTEKLKT